MDNYYLDAPGILSEHNFALIDRVKHQNIEASWPVLELVSPLLRPQAKLYPWLLPLNELSSDEWHRLLVQLGEAKNAQEPVCCLLLQSHSTKEALRDKLIKALYFTDEQRKGYILRYYDPRVFSHLVWMLTPYLLAQTLPVREVEHWTFWLEGKWHTVKLPLAFAWQPGDPHMLPVEQLQRCGLINQVLEQISPVDDMQQRQQVSQKIDGLIEQAGRLNFSDKHDQMAFALQGLKQSDAFWTAPKMAAFLRLAQKEAGLFYHGTESWDDARWQEMTQR